MPRLRRARPRELHGGRLRVYRSDDVIGVEIGGAVKNVLAIAVGICDGLGLGQNARAALITRGLAELARLGVALGGRAETVMGLTGAGDLILTATGDLSRNRRVGLELARGKPLQAIIADLGHVAEGVRSAHATLARAKSCGVDMPITAAVDAVLNGQRHAAASGRTAARARSESGRLAESRPDARLRRPLRRQRWRDSGCGFPAASAAAIASPA